MGKLNPKAQRCRLEAAHAHAAALGPALNAFGVPTTNGFGGRHTPATADAEVIRRLRAAGAVILGKLNMQEGALGAAGPTCSRAAQIALAGDAAELASNVVGNRRDDGTVEAGDRRINEAEAEVVRRVFLQYAAGQSPRAIALRLNEDGIPGPRCRGWGASHDQRQCLPRDRHPQQPDLHRQARLEQAALREGS